MFAGIIGRFQPPHIIHLELIQRMKDDGFIPIVLLGSADITGTEKDPYSTRQRTEMLRMEFPGLDTEPLNDYNNWDAWLCDILNILEIYEATTLYTFNKPEDVYKYFYCNGKHYHNSYFSEALSDAGIVIVNVIESSHPEIHARDIRSDLEGNKIKLTPEIYKYVKEH